MQMLAYMSAANRLLFKHQMSCFLCAPRMLPDCPARCGFPGSAETCLHANIVINLQIKYRIRVRVQQRRPPGRPRQAVDKGLHCACRLAARQVHDGGQGNGRTGNSRLGQRIAHRSVQGGQMNLRGQGLQLPAGSPRCSLSIVRLLQ